MATKVYGASDDLIEFEGEFNGECGAYGVDESEPVLIVMSDGTVLDAHYNDAGIWKVRLVRKGSLFVGIDLCVDSDADPHSDVANFGKGIKYAYFATKWEEVK